MLPISLTPQVTLSNGTPPKKSSRGSNGWLQSAPLVYLPRFYTTIPTLSFPHPFPSNRSYLYCSASDASMCVFILGRRRARPKKNEARDKRTQSFTQNKKGNPFILWPLANISYVIACLNKSMSQASRYAKAVTKQDMLVLLLKSRLFWLILFHLSLVYLLCWQIFTRPKSALTGCKGQSACTEINVISRMVSTINKSRYNMPFPRYFALLHLTLPVNHARWPRPAVEMPNWDLQDSTMRGSRQNWCTHLPLQRSLQLRPPGK